MDDSDIFAQVYYYIVTLYFIAPFVILTVRTFVNLSHKDTRQARLSLAAREIVSLAQAENNFYTWC